MDPSSSSSSSSSTPPSSSSKFWETQRTLLGSSSSLPPTPAQLYNFRTASLLTTTLSLILPTASLLYVLIPTNPSPSLSFLLGGLLGTLYLRGLTSYVSTIGKSAINDLGEVDLSDAGGGFARFAFLALMFVLGKAAEGKLMIGVMIPGFFMYQV
eukprot:CAMPEP_0118653912 /NCGR_PEP_ID=MMETSP0785-20121206/12085_1 /TAXON_ID=91992 /ORGANISM="Bolidomonas pacifica, Strain CCMP 1866" /LENGTH=154 /DNA_ID=CAMNT_0006546489 /DNA_START=244 /DNA_END=705 /DNA_ORIENTATION=+